MATADVKRHPIRGFFWGLLMGLGAYLILVGQKIVAIGEWATLGLVMLVAVAVNVLWGLFGPAKKAKAPKGYVPPAEPQGAAAFAETWTPPPVPDVPEVPPMDAAPGVPPMDAGVPEPPPEPT